jgi:KDO2-lipid IV(A) lauroyltransferase
MSVLLQPLLILFYYLIILPLSWLPMSLLYRISDGLYVLLYKLAGYRKGVVWSNLSGAFPEKSETELRGIMHRFYRHFFDLIVESLKTFTMSKKQSLHTFRVTNPELIDRYAQEGRNVMITTGHYNNWEFAAQSTALQIQATPAGIYHPLKNKFFEKKIRASRGKFGILLIPKNETKQFLDDHSHDPIALMMGTDQSPHNPRKALWTTFLGRETAVMFGSEKIAKEQNHVVVYGHIRKVSRGIYEMEFKLITENPRDTDYGEITIRHSRLLEKDILDKPDYWLWTHKRWKRERPEDMPLINEPIKE